MSQNQSELDDRLDNLFYRYRVAKNNGERRAIESEFVAYTDQAVQAFGEKVLGEAVPSDTTPAGEPEYVPVSVITSLMKDKA